MALSLFITRRTLARAAALFGVVYIVALAIIGVLAAVTLGRPVVVGSPVSRWRVDPGTKVVWYVEGGTDRASVLMSCDLSPYEVQTRQLMRFLETNSFRVPPVGMELAVAPPFKAAYLNGLPPEETGGRYVWFGEVGSGDPWLGIAVLVDASDVAAGQVEIWRVVCGDPTRIRIRQLRWGVPLRRAGWIGAQLWLLWVGALVARAYVRMRRSMCIACGYQLDGISGRCSECGRLCIRRPGGAATSTGSLGESAGHAASMP